MGRFSGVAFRVSEFLWNSGVLETLVLGRPGNCILRVAIRGCFFLGGYRSHRLRCLSGTVRELSEGEVSGQKTRDAFE
jgi:hypothetical protein